MDKNKKDSLISMTINEYLNVWSNNGFFKESIVGEGKSFGIWHIKEREMLSKMINSISGPELRWAIIENITKGDKLVLDYEELCFGSPDRDGDKVYDLLKESGLYSYSENFMKLGDYNSIYDAQDAEISYKLSGIDDRLFAIGLLYDKPDTFRGAIINPMEIREKYYPGLEKIADAKIDQATFEYLVEDWSRENDAREFDLKGTFIDTNEYKKGILAKTTRENLDREQSINGIMNAIGCAGLQDKQLKKFIKYAKQMDSKNIDMNIAALARGLSPEAKDKFLIENSDLIGPAKCLALMDSPVKQQVKESRIGKIVNKFLGRAKVTPNQIERQQLPGNQVPVIETTKEEI